MTELIITTNEYHTVNLLPKWCELDCDGNKIDAFINSVEEWYDLLYDRGSTMVWCWKYDPDFEYENAGVVGIVFNSDHRALRFMQKFGICLDETT